MTTSDSLWPFISTLGTNLQLIYALLHLSGSLAMTAAQILDTIQQNAILLCTKVLRTVGDHSNSLHSFILLGSCKDSGFSAENVAEGPAAISLLVETGDWTEGD